VKFCYRLFRLDRLSLSLSLSLSLGSKPLSLSLASKTPEPRAWAWGSKNSLSWALSLWTSLITTFATQMTSQTIYKTSDQSFNCFHYIRVLGSELTCDSGNNHRLKLIFHIYSSCLLYFICSRSEYSTAGFENLISKLLISMSSSINLFDRIYNMNKIPFISLFGVRCMSYKG
jgi:hypothetical protein